MPIQHAANANRFFFPDNTFHKINLVPGHVVQMTAEIDKPNVQFYFFAAEDNFVTSSTHEVFIHNFNTDGALNWAVPTGYSTGYVFAQMAITTAGTNGNNHDFTVGPNDGKDFPGKQGATLRYSLIPSLRETVLPYSGNTVMVPTLVTRGHMLGVYPDVNEAGLTLKIVQPPRGPLLIEQNVVINVMSGCDGTVLTQFTYEGTKLMQKNLDDCGRNSNVNIMAFIVPTVNGNELDFDIGDPLRDGKVKIVSV